MNQPLNVPLEHSFLGPRLELGGSAFKVSPELQELQERYLGAKNEKQSMQISTSCFAMASPIMPLGFLAVLFLLGKLDGMDQDPFSKEEQRTLKGDMARIAAAEALIRKRKDNGEDMDSNAYIRYASREMQLRPLRNAMRPLRGSEKRVIPKQQHSITAPAEFFVTREKMAKDREAKRQKMLIESLNNKEGAEQKHIEQNALSEKLEKLDQLLKKMES